MNFALLLGWGVLCILILFLAQTIGLAIVGHRPLIAFPMRHSSESTFVRWWMKAFLQGVLVMILLFPLVLGQNPITYYQQKVAPSQWLLLLRTMGMTIALFIVFFTVAILGGWVKFTMLYDRKTSIKKLIRASLSPLPLAFMEEAVFRGVVLEQLLQSFPTSRLGIGIAIVISALLFSSVHFFRDQKHVFLPAVGLFGLGLALGVAYVVGGHTIWLPVAMHAAGVWCIQLSRVFAEYEGPSWLVGYRSYPICGVLGFGLMVLLTGWVVVLA